MAEGLAVQLDAVGVLEEAIEDGVGDGGVAECLVPMGDRKL